MENDGAITWSDLYEQLSIINYISATSEVDICIMIRLVTSWEISFEKVTLIKVSIGNKRKRKLILRGTNLNSLKRKLETSIFQVMQLADKKFHLK